MVAFALQELLFCKQSFKMDHQSFSSADRLTVLVADDDAIFCQIMETRLARANCQVLLASDGGEAWRLVRSQAINLAVVDFEMPGLDGIALIQCLRGHPATRHVPIIMCTSRDDTEAMKLAVDAGASMFLNKPINWSAFDSHIGHLLQLSRSRSSMLQLQTVLSMRDVQVERFVGVLEQIVRSSAPGSAVGALAAVEAALGRFRADYGATVAGAAVEPAGACSMPVIRTAV